MCYADWLLSYPITAAILCGITITIIQVILVKANRLNQYAGHTSQQS